LGKNPQNFKGPIKQIVCSTDGCDLNMSPTAT